jgi:hypothetical protein
VEADRCERRDDGFLIPSRILARRPFVQYMLESQSHLQKLFAGLAEFGIPSLWNDEADGLRGAA